MKVTIPALENYDYSGDMFALVDLAGNTTEAYLIVDNQLEFRELQNDKLNYRYAMIDLIVNEAIGLLKDNQEVLEEFAEFKHISKSDIEVVVKH